jgi:hypothetical protein
MHARRKRQVALGPQGIEALATAVRRLAGDPGKISAIVRRELFGERPAPDRGRVRSSWSPPPAAE